MKVQKRSGILEDVSFDKILNRMNALSFGEEFENKLNIDPTIIAQKVCSEIYDGVTTRELDILANGFKPRTSNSNINGTNTYIFGAWADVPFKYNNPHP